MRVHQLKTWPPFYRALINGTKTFEVRRDDRGFKVGQMLELREFDPDTETYTGRHTMRTITYLLPGGHFGIEPGYVVMGLA